MEPGPLQALILAGGQSRRLGGVPKAGLLIEGRTLLARTVDAVAAVLVDRTGTAEGGIGVVGPINEVSHWLEGAQSRETVLVVQEDPPFSGPAAGIAAGIGALSFEKGHVLVLACDMPSAGAVARLLVDALAGCAQGQGVMAVADGKKQPLAAIYPLNELHAEAEAARAAHRLENASVFALVANVNMKELVVPAALTADIDTWADARAQGIAAGAAGAEG